MMKINIMPIILISSAVLSLVSCQKDDDSDKKELLQGTWLNTMINDVEVLTDNVYLLKFNADDTEVHCKGFILDDDNKRWLEDPDYSYSVSGEQVLIDGVGHMGDEYSMVLSVISLNDESFCYSVPSFTINGNLITDTCIYTCKKVTEELDAAFIGVWHGRCTTIGNADSLYHYWEYFEDGSYNYYYQDENENWIKKSDNEGHYFLYGDFLATNYSFDLISGGTGLAYECWNIDIEGDNMTWEGVRNEGSIVNYEMERVASPPVTLP